VRVPLTSLPCTAAKPCWTLGPKEAPAEVKEKRRVEPRVQARLHRAASTRWRAERKVSDLAALDRRELAAHGFEPDGCARRDGEPFAERDGDEQAHAARVSSRGRLDELAARPYTRTNVRAASISAPTARFRTTKQSTAGAKAAAKRAARVGPV